MGAQFIGAGSASGRRRRRLLLSENAFGTATSVSRAPSSGRSSAEGGAPEPTRVVTCLNSLIRPQPWVNWLLVTFGIGLWAAVLYVGWTVDHSGSGLKQVLGLRSGRLAGLFGAVCLLGATQFSLVALWYRTRSRKDFQGRYRIWIWSSLVLATLFSAAISGWHLWGSEWIAKRVPGHLRSAAMCAWLLGATILVATAIRLLAREMSRAKSARWLLRSAQLIAGAALVLHFEPGLAPASIVLELQSGLASLWPLLTASALLHHARYVIHVSNEAMPSVRRTGRLSPIVQQVWAEVLSLGPSKATMVSSLSPRNIWGMMVRLWNGSKILAGAIGRLIGRRVAVGRKKRVGSQGADRRKSAPSLPTIAMAVDSPAKSTHKSASKSVKSA